MTIFARNQNREIMKINNTKLLVQDILESDKVSKGGLILPTAVIKTDSMKAKIVAVGDGTPDIKIPYNVGETVLFHPRAGVCFKYEDQDYRLIDVSDCFLGGI
jgi:co-chaperonin GroES (HSP10)